MKSIAHKSLTAVSILALAFTPIAVTSQTVGVSSAVRNNVKVKETVQSQAVQAVLKQRVKLGNAITTGTNSGLQVTLLDKSTLTLGPNARMTVDRFVYDPTKRSSSVGTTVAKGTFRFLSGKPAKGGRNGITTPAASIGIRGTIVEGAVGQDAIDIASQQPGLPLAGSNPETATIVVLRGPGPGAQLGEQQGAIDVTAGGQTVTITTPGQAVFIPFAGAPPSAPFQVSNNSFQMFDQVLRTAPQSYSVANPTPGQQPAQQPAQQPGQQPAQQPGQQPQNPGSNPGSNPAQTSGGPGGGAGGAGGGGGGIGGAAGAGAGAGGGGIGALGGLLGALGAAGLAGLAVSGGGDDAPASP